METKKKKFRVVASCTTIPSRLPLIGKTIAQMANQSIKPDIICFGIPLRSKREKCAYDFDILRTEVDKAAHLYGYPSDKIRIATLAVDYGPLCKLAGALAITSSTADQNTILITIDDDQIYDLHVIETLLSGVCDHPGCVVCLCGHALSINRHLGVYEWGFRSSGFDKNAFTSTFQLLPNSPVDIVSGWCGVAYPRWLLPDNLDHDLEAIRKIYNPILHRNDDIYISAWLSKLRISRVVVAYPRGTVHIQHEDKSVGRRNPLSLSGSNSFLMGNVKHFVEWWRLVSYMREHGYFQETAAITPRTTVPLKSLSFVGAATTTFLFTGIFMLTFYIFRHGSH